MIVYIINGKTPSVQQAIDYVCDDKKTAKSFDEIRSEYDASAEIKEDMSLEEYYLSCEDNINRALNYIANEDKIGGYISGYLCDPELAEEQFRQTKEINLARVGKKLKDDKGNYFYHIIQSFPDGIDISDDEVHQCGLELVERLGLYQAVVTSHIHPAIDEEGEVHGKCKHNHIIINSHIYYELVDPSHPSKMKYNSCKESYAQLQLINDQIAIQHGLPIIVNEEKDHAYSWYENEKINKGKSWKQRVRIDINNAMKTSMDFASFEEAITAAGYKIRNGKSKTHGEYVTYTCPDNNHKVRDYVLGESYTKSQLEAYWDLKKNIADDLIYNNDASENRIERIIGSTSDPLFIKFEKNLSQKRKEKMREHNLNLKNTYTNYFPLNPQTKTYSRAELTYFQPSQTYQITNDEHRIVAEVGGDEILKYFNQLYEQRHREREEERQRRKDELKDYYSNLGFISSATKTPYKVRLWDQNGRRRSTIELIVILAIVTIDKESGKWEPKEPSSLPQQEITRHPIYAKKDWKIQNMLDTIKIAREENVQNPNELEERLNMVGKDTSKAKAEVRRLTAAQNKMEVLYEAIEGYEEVRAVCEKIYALPDGAEKTKLQQQYANEIDDYKRYKSVMYRHKVTSDEEKQDFLERYQTIKDKLQSAEKEAEKCKEEYRQLSKLKYNLQLAQNKQYCYGPEYIEPEQEPQEPEQPEQERPDEKTK